MADTATNPTTIACRECAPGLLECTIAPPPPGVVLSLSDDAYWILRRDNPDQNRLWHALDPNLKGLVRRLGFRIGRVEFLSYRAADHALVLRLRAEMGDHCALIAEEIKEEFGLNELVLNWDEPRLVHAGMTC